MPSRQQQTGLREAFGSYPLERTGALSAGDRIAGYRIGGDHSNLKAILRPADHSSRQLRSARGLTPKLRRQCILLFGRSRPAEPSPLGQTLFWAVNPWIYRLRIDGLTTCEASAMP